jgi:hypothetical protein
MLYDPAEKAKENKVTTAPEPEAEKKKEPSAIKRILSFMFSLHF